MFMNPGLEPIPVRDFMQVLWLTPFLDAHTGSNVRAHSSFVEGPLIIQD